MVKIKIKNKKDDRSEYRKGADKIQSYVDNFLAQVSNLLTPHNSKLVNFSSNRLHEKDNELTRIVDAEALRFLKSIKDQKVLDAPFEYFMFGVMLRANNIDNTSDCFWVNNFSACRLVDTHKYWKMAKQKDKSAIDVLAVRGWFKK